jgi:hypothetical protein
VYLRTIFHVAEQYSGNTYVEACTNHKPTHTQKHLTSRTDFVTYLLYRLQNLGLHIRITYIYYNTVQWLSVCGDVNKP